MSLLDRFRRARPPGAVLKSLQPSDRVLAWAMTDDGVVVASTGGLRLPAGQFLPWHRIDKAQWGDGLLIITEAVEVEPGVYEAQRPEAVPLPDPGDVPATVRSRVTRSVAYSSYHTLGGHGGVRVVGRRVPGVDGVAWSLRFDPGTDRDDPAVRKAANQLLADARASATPAE